VFVVAIAKAVHTLGHVHDGHIPAEYYAKYVLIMVPLWWAWTGHTLFANRFDTDDVLQRLMTLAQMVCAISLAVFVDVDFDANYRGFLFSYAAFRGLLVLMYWRAAATAENGTAVARYLANGFTIGVLISLSSLLFENDLRYVVFYAGIGIDMLVPLVGRDRLKRVPVQEHHMPERFGLLTIILLGESVAGLVSSVEDVGVSGRAMTAAFAGFAWTAAIWWTYYENLEHRIYGRSLGTGQATIYLHLLIYICLGGIANTIRFAIDPALALAEYKILAGGSTVGFVVALELLHLTYHRKVERGPLLRNAAILFALVIGATVLSPSSLISLLAMAAIFVAYAVRDAARRR
jgi:low temperature requirement protein LtrA